MGLLGFRIAAGIVAALAIAFVAVRRRAVLEHLRVFFFEPLGPENLALLRIALFGALAYVSTQTSAVWWASVPADLRVMPYGWRWAREILPLDAALATSAQLVVVSTSVLAMLGAGTRVTAPVAALGAVYLLGAPSFFGKILHLDHALVMMALVIACSPCGDALSLDRFTLRARGIERPIAPSPKYTLPIRLAWLLLGTIYLFPGLWKVWENGDLWVNGQRLLWELHDEWGQRKDFTLPARIDEMPVLLCLLGTATLIFEVGFFFAIFYRPTRVLAAFSAMAFHIGVRMFLGIRFYEYVPLLMLIDLPLLQRWLPSAWRRDEAEPTVALPPREALRAAWPSALAGGLLLTGQLFVGLARIDTWPIALHPTFHERSGTEQVARNHVIDLERTSAAPKDIGRAMVKLGAKAGFMRMALAFDRDVAKGIPRQKRGRALIALLHDSGVELAPGDHLAIYTTRWNVYPIGERSGFSKKLLRRYEVTTDRGLALILDNEKGKKKTKR